MSKAVLKDTEEFKPIVLEITIESSTELKDLWHRFDINPSVYMNKNRLETTDEDLFADVWHVLNKEVDKRGLFNV